MVISLEAQAAIERPGRSVERMGRSMVGYFPHTLMLHMHLEFRVQAEVIGALVRSSHRAASDRPQVDHMAAGAPPVRFPRARTDHIAMGAMAFATYVQFRVRARKQVEIEPSVPRWPDTLLPPSTVTDADHHGPPPDVAAFDTTAHGHARGARPKHEADTTERAQHEDEILPHRNAKLHAAHRDRKDQ